MSLQRSGVFVVVCSIAALPGVVACGGKNQGTGSGGASATGGSGGAGHADGGNVGVGGAPGGLAGHGGGSPIGGAAGHSGGAAVGGASAGGGPAMGGASSGGGGASGSGGTSSGGGASAGAAGAAAGAGGGSGCSGLSQTRSSRSAKSTGFTGSYDTDYYPLYSHACTTVGDCATACVTAGGTQASCAASECVDSTPDYCLPPTYWFGLDQLLIEGNTTDSSAWIIMVYNPYQDQLQASNFQFEIPAGAKIHGIQFSLNESADSENEIGDASVRALANGAAVGLDRGHTTPWTTAFHYENYGGPTDLWGTATWTPDVVNATGFGVALTPMYLDTAGNARAYVDFIKATVYYDTCQ